MKVRSEKHGVEAEVFFYQDGDELPTTGTYFVVTSEGYFIHIDGGGVVSGLVPCRKEDLTPFLGKLEEKAFYNFPPIPFEQFVQALTFSSCNLSEAQIRSLRHSPLSLPYA